MNIQLHSTSRVVELVTPNGKVPARIWEGITDSGIKVHAYITRIAHDIDLPEEQQLQFKQELQQTVEPTSDIAAIPLRLII